MPSLTAGVTAGAASALMNISGPEISCACTLSPSPPCPPSLSAPLFPCASAQHQGHSTAGARCHPAPLPGDGHLCPQPLPGMDGDELFLRGRWAMLVAHCRGRARASPHRQAQCQLGVLRTAPVFPRTPVPIPSPGLGLRDCRSPGTITCRVRAGEWGQPRAQHLVDLSLTPLAWHLPLRCHLYQCSQMLIVA